MNAAEHIVQTFLWEAESKKKKCQCRRYLTISNVIGSNNNEIDILAMSGDGEDLLRLECEIAVDWYLEPRYIEERIRRKLIDNNHSCKLCNEIFAGKDYRKVFIVWKSPYNEDTLLPEELVQQGVEVWSLTDILQDLLNTIGTSNYQDDISRFASMLSAMLSTENSLRGMGCKRVSATVNDIKAIDCVEVIAKLAAHCATKAGVKTVTESHVKQALTKVRELIEP